MTRRLASTLFDGAWAFFLPYLGLYLIAWALGISTVALRNAFMLLHLVLLGTLAWWLPGKWKGLSRAEKWFWPLAFLAFLLPGAYLEYPADPWEHFRRIFYWQTPDSVSAADGMVRIRFSYFWAWSWLWWVPIEWRRLGVSVYGAVMETLLSLQVYFLARRLGFAKEWSLVQVMGFWVLFGIGPFSFRYYALASTTLAYLAYLRGIIAILDWTDENARPRAGTLLGVALLTALNHVQECGLLLVSALALLFARSWRRGKFRLPVKWPVVVPLGTVFILVVGWLCFHYRDTLMSNLVRPKISFGHISKFANFRIWDPSLQYFDTLGIPGFAALALAAYHFRRIPELATLTLAPVFLLLCPVFALFAVYLAGPHAPFYRLLFALPTSFVLVYGLQVLSPRSTVTAGLLLIGLALWPKSPWRGRFIFQFHRPHDKLALVSVDEAAAWISRNRRGFRSCRLATDDITDFVLSAHLGRPLRGDRTRPWMVKQGLGETSHLLSRAPRDPGFCGILLADPNRVGALPRSRMARWAGHWSQDLADHARAVGNLPDELRALLLGEGWKITQVPPFYTLYEPARDHTR